MALEAQIRHLLRRTEYIARPARVAALVGGTLAQAVDDILNVTTPVAIPGSIYATDNDWEQYVAATQWWFDRMAFDSPRPIQEKMTFFWHGHFTSEWGKVEDTKMMMDQNKLYRDNAFGNFAGLAQAMAIQPAMLVYLDNASNIDGAPNQNFARELMELYLLGVGNYTEDDVEASARAWTGYSINDDTGAFVFRSSDHDSGNKTFFGHTGNWNGPDIITMILNDKGAIAARYIVGKLWNYFATPVGPQPAALDAIAASFRNDWQIKPVVRALLLLPEFYDTPVTQGLVRTPVDFIVATMALTGYRTDDLNPQWYTDAMGQVPFNPPNVSGWRPNAAWINTSSMGARAEFAGNVVNHLMNDNAYDWDALMIGPNNNPVSVDAAIDVAANLFAINPLSGPTRDGMRTFLNLERAAVDDPATEDDWEGRNTWYEVSNLLQMALIAPEMHLA